MRRPSIVDRPEMPAGYGITEEPAGMLDWGWAVEHVAAARNYWICTTRADGRPHAAPVWGLWRDDGVMFSTSADSVKGRNLTRDPRVVVHLESGDDVVILEGEGEPVGLDDAAADAYEAKYAYRPEASEGGWYLLRPDLALAWREQDFPKSATRFRFERP